MLANRALACGFLSLLIPLACPASRPLPEDVDIPIDADRQPGRLELQVRIPLAVLRNAQLPTRPGTDSLDPDALEPLLPGLVRYWLSPVFEVFEDGQPVKPGILHAHIISPGETIEIAFDYPLRSQNPIVAINPKVAQLGVRVSTNITYMSPDKSIRVFNFQGDPGLIYPEARPRDAMRQFLAAGFRFIYSSADFLLFLFCLALPLRQYRTVFPAVLTFAGAICLALFAAGVGFAPDALWFRPLIETLSALAILLAALANIMGGVTSRRRALFALAAGVVFGYVCSVDLAAKIQFAASHPLLAREAFALGAALAVALAIALLAPALAFVFRFARTKRVELIVISALAADTAWVWLSERWDRLSQIPLQAPIFDAPFVAATLRWLAFAVLLGGLFWLVAGWLKQESERR